MAALTIDAIFQNGVLKPTVKLDLPENTPVKITLMPSSDAGSSGESFGALRGIWSDVQFPTSIEIALQQVRALTETKLEQLAKDLVNG